MKTNFLDDPKLKRKHHKRLAQIQKERKQFVKELEDAQRLTDKDFGIRFNCRDTILAAILALLLAGCITSPDGTRRLDTTAINSIAALAVDLAAAHLGVSPESARAIRTGSADLFGIAAQAQANLGKRPVAVNVAQGAAHPEIGLAVQAQLPPGPIEQRTVNALFEAAEQAKTVTKP